MTELQLKSRTRQELFWYLKGIALRPFISRGLNYDCFTEDEISELRSIEFKINSLLKNQFENSKEVGLNPKRRCFNCGKVAKYKVLYFEKPEYICKKCLSEMDKTSPFTGYRTINNIEEINPND